MKAENASLKQASDSFTVEEVIEEISERAKRKKNILLFKVPEKDPQQSNERHTEADRQEVKATLHVVSPELNCDEIKPVRLGKFERGKSRPIKISFTNEITVRNLISNARKLKDSNYKNISMSYYRTPRQIQLHKEVKRQLDERKSAGDHNCQIKYIDDVPRIVNLN
nr:unnamed protein product [Callosobruchus analis]